MNLSKPFAGVAVIGVVEAVYHAWSEDAFTTNLANVSYSPYAALYGVPYWAFGLVWFPLVFVVGLWASRMGREPLKRGLLALLTVGNLFTAYLWYLDVVVVRSYTWVYVALYVTNYVMTAMVVADSWPKEEMRGFLYGTVTGAVVGLVFGPFGVAVFGIGGGVFGALKPFVMPARY